jgi:hypothetical protein
MDRIKGLCCLSILTDNGRNRASGDDMMLEARRMLDFKCWPVLRDKINVKG